MSNELKRLLDTLAYTIVGIYLLLASTGLVEVSKLILMLLGVFLLSLKSKDIFYFISEYAGKKVIRLFSSKK